LTKTWRYNKKRGEEENGERGFVQSVASGRQGERRSAQADAGGLKKRSDQLVSKVEVWQGALVHVLVLETKGKEGNLEAHVACGGHSEERG